MVNLSKKTKGDYYNQYELSSCITIVIAKGEREDVTSKKERLLAEFFLLLSNSVILQ